MSRQGAKSAKVKRILKEDYFLFLGIYTWIWLCVLSVFT